MILRDFKPFRFYYKWMVLLLQNLGRPLLYLILITGVGILFLINLFKHLSIKKIAFAVSSFVIIVGLVIFSFFLKTLYSLPPADALASRSIDISTKIYDRNGELLYSLYKDKNRSLVKYEDIPQQVKLATLAAEDAQFYAHKGFSIKGMTRAAFKFLQDGRVTGGSTITQQLIKNALLTPEKSIIRKVKEIFIAVSVEQKYSKDEILTMYLNEVSYGGTAYGIKAAADMYFNKNLKDLNIAESALLAGLTQRPSVFSPFGSHPEKAKQRQIEILNLMQENGFITKAQAESAKTQELKYANNATDIKAPHFVMYVKEILAKEYGEDALLHNGLEVYTTLDSKTQKLTEQIVKTEVEKIGYLNVSNGAAVIANPQNGEILAMVGSKNYFDETIDGNVNVALQPRQPGSSIKMINYAYALENKIKTPASVIDDSPITFKQVGGPDYTPKNYDGKFRGKITLRQALAESRNIPAVKILNEYGVDKMIEMGRKMGITTWEDKNRFGLSLTLGGGEVKLIELAQAYQVIANKGERIDFNPILKIVNSNKETIFERNCDKNFNCSREFVLKPETAFILTDILADNNARVPAFGSFSALVVADHPEVAVKTGTSNDLRDNLTVGFNQNYLVAVWVGNNDNSPMSRVASGITGASPIWNKLITSLIGESESIAWEVPENLERIAVCKYTGLPSCGCKDSEEWFERGSFEEQPCIANNPVIPEQIQNLPPGRAKKLEKRLN